METPNTPASKPVVALMGEFSAGKSTLANLLLDEDMSPVKVTATQMPPIMYTHGHGQAIQVGLDGSKTVLPDGGFNGVSVDDTAYVLKRSQAGVLDLMDLIDMPGISDPNLSAESWKRTIHNADVVIWCSHATQAWRQSEAATWNELPEYLRQNSFLLLTRFDKILTEKDGQRVLNRVKAETSGLFRGVFPISLLEASNAGEDREAWESSGAEAFMQVFLDTVFEVVAERNTPRVAKSPSGISHPEQTPPNAANGRLETLVLKPERLISPKRIKPRKRTGEATVRPPKSSMQEFLL